MSNFTIDLSDAPDSQLLSLELDGESVDFSCTDLRCLFPLKEIPNESNAEYKLKTSIDKQTFSKGPSQKLLTVIWSPQPLFNENMSHMRHTEIVMSQIEEDGTIQTER